MSLFGAKSEVLETISGEEMNAVVRELGFVPDLGKDSKGDPAITVNIEGFRTGILFYSCKEGRASSLQFLSGFSNKPSPDKVNEWNLTYRFAKAFLDKEGDVLIQYDIALDGGVHRQYLAAAVKHWRSLLVSFVSFMRT